ncbi:MAG TPA: hypothetical protein VFI46_02410 [Jiangellaceae bacterium]|nr:hypothetical protein [Jiangellaceae bacterium]
MHEWLERVGAVGGGDRPAAEVVVEGGGGPGVSELVGDVPDAEALVEPGCDGLTEDVAGHLRVADPGHGLAQVGLGVRRVADHSQR